MTSTSDGGLPPATHDGDVVDELGSKPVLHSETVHRGMVWDVVRDTVDLGPAGQVRREYVRHPGAVGVLALDDSHRMLMIRQYRHPVGAHLWELPAGLLDVDGEAPLAAAQRELEEEADLRAGRWHVLVDWFNSPGGMSEALRLYLARDLSGVAHADRFDREHEELGMPTAWVPLDAALEAVLSGRVHNPTAVVGILAANAARGAGWSSLRPPDSPWPEHPAYR